MVAIPEVDFSSPDAAEQLRRACTDVGFFYLVHHGIPAELLAQVYAEMRAFFSQPLEEKRKVLANEQMRGYTLMNEETLDPAVQTRGDTKEGYYICRHVPPDSDEMQLPLHGPNVFPDAAAFPTFQSTMETYHAAMCALGFRVAQLFAEAAGHKGRFDGPGMFDKPMAALRLLHYAPEKSDVARGVFGAGAHTDYGLITLLSTDATGGLQICHEGQWVDVPPRADAFVVNIGDMAERFTNGRFKSTLHRVVNTSGQERYSVPFFYEPNFTCVVECFPSCVSAENPAKYPPTTSGQHLVDMYKQTHTSFDAEASVASDQQQKPQKSGDMVEKSNLFNFGVASAELRFSLEGEGQRAKVRVPRLEDSKSGSKSVELPLFRDDEDIRGVLTVAVDAGKSLQHTGLKLELLGLIEVPVDRSAGDEFTSSVRELQPSGEAIEGEATFPFDFAKVDKPHESYYGKSVKLRYVLRATLARGNYASSLVQEQDLWVQRVAPPPPVDRSIKMEVGIEDCLHIEFEYDKSRYHLKDVVIGKIFFLLVRIKIKHMELAILRRESVGAGTQRHSESETVTKFEIMDGAPIKGESVPVRLYLSPYALTPTYRNVQSRFSVKYFLNLVLVDEEDRRYFKQQEITLWRKNIG